MKIGIIGGTFDPLHVSHINIASKAKKQFDLEQIWFMLSPICRGARGAEPERPVVCLL